MKKVIALLLSISVLLFSIVLVLNYYKGNSDNSRFEQIELELEYLRGDHDTILKELDTLNYKLDTLSMDVKDLKKGQKFIYDEVKKSNSSSFLDLFGL